MIWESSYWKIELSRVVIFLKRKIQQKRWSPTDGFQIEKNIFFAVYAIRKMIEAKTELSDAAEKQNINVKKYFLKSESEPDLMNWHHIDRFYDMESPKRDRLSLEHMCNQFVHSYIFMPLVTDNGQTLKGLLVASDRYKGKFIYQIEAVELIRIFEFIANDEIVKAHQIRGQNGEWAMQAKLNQEDALKAHQDFMKI